VRGSFSCWRQRAFGGLLLFYLLLPPIRGAYSIDEAPKPPPPGKLVDIGGYRLHFDCTGRGGPAVVLEAGAGDFSFDWSRVQPEVARFTRVCSYDRAGSAWSDPGPTPRTMHQEVFELHTLLRKAKVRGPYVLVGHSYGGLLVRLYTRQYPREVAGMVLVDSTDPDTTLMLNNKLVHIREGARGRPIPPSQSMKTSPPKLPSADDIRNYQNFLKFLGPPKISPPYDRLPPEAQKLDLWARFHPQLIAGGNDFWAEELQQLYLETKEHPYPLGNLPLTVLASGKAEGGPPPGLSLEEWQRLREEKRQEKESQAHLSRNSQFILDPQSGHHLQLDHPELVIDAIRRVVEAARRHTRLTAAS
jgi:pimeloyl-ACP methyl ester carboxylesterase